MGRDKEREKEGRQKVGKNMYSSLRGDFASAIPRQWHRAHICNIYVYAMSWAAHTHDTPPPTSVSWIRSDVHRKGPLYGECEQLPLLINPGGSAVVAWGFGRRQAGRTIYRSIVCSASVGVNIIGFFTPHQPHRVTSGRITQSRPLCTRSKRLNKNTSRKLVHTTQSNKIAKYNQAKTVTKTVKIQLSQSSHENGEYTTKPK